MRKSLISTVVMVAVAIFAFGGSPAWAGSATALGLAAKVNGQLTGLLASQLVASPDGTVRVSEQGVAPSYSAGTGPFTPAATPTDVSVLTAQAFGSVIKLKRVRVGCTATSAGTVTVLLQKSVNGGGGTQVSINTGKHDLRDYSATGLAYYYSANRTSNGNGISSTRPVIRSGEMTCATSTTAGTPIEWRFGEDGGKSPTIRDLIDWLAVNLNAQTLPSGMTMNVDWGWQEERGVRVAVIGNSLISNATSGLLNGGANNGGMGLAGTLNSLATINNYGSNGFRLYDYLQNLNGVTFSANAVQGQAPDVELIHGYLANDLRTGQASLNQGVALLDSLIYSIKNGTTSGQVYVSPKATAFTITSAVYSGGTVTVTTATPHGWQTGGTVNAQIAGVSLSGYNGYYALTVTGTNTFTYALGADPGGAGSGGTATYAIKWATNNTATPDALIILWGENGVTADDAGDGPHFYLSAAGNTTLSGLWSGMTLAQAASALTQMLYQIPQQFVGDPRVFSVVQSQDITMPSPIDGTTVAAFPSYSFGTVNTNVNTPTTGTLATTMSNQLHPSARGQVLKSRQIAPYVVKAINAAGAYFF